jgi:glycosyltransferase involved in cell wall biosynthesis
MTVTVFTPTYNRAYRIEALYKSLKEQTCKDFEWLIVDDGSTDNTEETVLSWGESCFAIRYIKQPNGGKHRAVNHGVMEAKGELFFIVDSDDILTPNSIERILHHYDAIKDDKSFGGLCGLKAYYNGEKVGGGEDFGILDCNPIDFRFKYKMKGDMSEVIRTDVMREFPFPEFEGERFCSEMVLFNRIATKYKLRYFYEKIYLCEYLEDGLTAAIVKIRMNSPKASKLCYFELFHYNIPIAQKIKAAINFWRFACCDSSLESIYKGALSWGWLLMPIGYLYHIKDSI